MSEIAKRYATALFDSAPDGAERETLFKDLSQFKTVLFGSTELRSLVKNPLVPKQALLPIFQEILEKGKASKIFTHFFLTLIEEGRLHMVVDIIDAFTDLHNTANNIEKATVTSACELSADDQGKFRQFLEAHFNKKLILSFAVDSKIIGGFRVLKGSEQIDSSIQTQIFNLSRTLKGAS